MMKGSQKSASITMNKDKQMCNTSGCEVRRVGWHEQKIWYLDIKKNDASNTNQVCGCIFDMWRSINHENVNSDYMSRCCNTFNGQLCPGSENLSAESTQPHHPRKELQVNLQMKRPEWPIEISANNYSPKWTLVHCITCSNTSEWSLVRCKLLAMNIELCSI